MPEAPAAANKNTRTNGAAAALAGKSEADIRIAANDTAKALMLIRAYRIRGHLEADLDPLNLVKQAPHRELDPATYGFGEGDWQQVVRMHDGRVCKPSVARNAREAGMVGHTHRVYALNQALKPVKVPGI